MKTSIGLLERYAKEIAGVVGCFDRLVVSGTLTEIAFPEAMDAVLHREGFRAFDIGLFAEPLRQRIRDNAVTLAQEAGMEIAYLSRSKGVRKEDLVAKVLARRGQDPGLVHVLSVVESCSTFKPWRHPQKGQPGLRMQTGKCSTYDFYLIDPELGRMDVRVPTWLPCRLQIYFTVHSWLAAQLREAGVEFKMEDNSLCRDRRLGAGGAGAGHGEVLGQTLFAGGGSHQRLQDARGRDAGQTHPRPPVAQDV